MAKTFPSTVFKARTMTLPLSREQRLEMEQAIEDAIALLDAADGDDDLELDDSDMEPDDFPEETHTEEVLVYGMDQTKPPFVWFERPGFVGWSRALGGW
jgi:hypothetical protein